MKVLIFIILILGIQFAHSDDVKIEINPTKPVAGEMFQAIFRVYTDADEEPVINFSSYQIEVVGKNNYGVKTSTVYMNGKFSTSRELTIIYDLSGSRPGVAGLRDITVQVGSKTLRHPSLNFTILKEPEVAADVFVIADVPKKPFFTVKELWSGIIFTAKCPLVT